MNERLGKGITPNKNAKVLLWKAIGPKPGPKPLGTSMPAEYFKLLGIAEPPPDGAYFVTLYDYLKGHLKPNPEQAEVNAFFEKLEQAGARPWTPKDYPHFAAWLKANEQSLALVTEACRRPDYFNPIVSSSKKRENFLLMATPDKQPYRELALALVARAMLRVGQERFEEAWQDLLTCHRLGRLIARDSGLYELLVGISIDRMASNADLAYLERAKLTAEQAQDRLKDLKRLPTWPPPADKVELRGRFACLDTVRTLRRGDNSLSPADLKTLDRIDWEATLHVINHWIDRQVTALRFPDRSQRVKALQEFDTELRALAKNIDEPETYIKRLIANKQTPGNELGEVLVAVLSPSASKVMNAHDSAEQRQRNLHVALALAGYRADHGRYPAKLNDLVPNYLTSIPDDIFSGKDLHYRTSENGYLLYSVGVNGQDEEGRAGADTPPGDDITVRMPLPELKR